MKKFLRSTVATSALLSLITAGALAQTETEQSSQSEDRFVLPYTGDINPFYGDINPFYGDINPFYGDISPFWGDISPFWGDINPFHGDISPFTGDINPFWGDISPFYGDINPFYGDIAPFWGDIGPFWGDINAFWGDIGAFDGGANEDYVTLTTQIQSMFDQAEAIFGATYEETTGQTFSDGFQTALLEQYGIDISDPASLEAVSAEQRSAFFMAFYDGLMSYSGFDHIDHWMPAINWSPALSQMSFSGNGVVVGMLDFSFANDQDVNVRTSGGEHHHFDFNHGAAVAGLIGAAHDGQGVMGVAPGATLVTYNPFDSSLSTNWTDVSEGVQRLTQQGASILNLSLGMPGWTLPQEWANVFTDQQIAQRGGDTLFVIAAGNDGSTQTTDLDWSGVPFTDNVLVVGSVNPNGEISSFSNRPGTSCLLVDGGCPDGNRLMDRFLVAPGEMILVSDSDGGVVRQSGTSFAAPLVSGAAALIQGRWNWLQANDVADILLLSARDLGAPGVDAVYGHGLLDVSAAMSPLDPNNLFAINSGNQRKAVRNLGLTPGRMTFRSSGENAVILFEEINDTFRDFVISLDDITLDADITSEASRVNAETYLLERSGQTAGTGFTDTGSYSRIVSTRGNFQVSAFIAPTDPRSQIANGELPFQAGFSFIDSISDRELRLGHGEGALALSSQNGFGLFSDHRPETGGVNPVLGFASGGVYVSANIPVGKKTRMSFGVSSAMDEHVFVMPVTGEETPLFDGMPTYEAFAFIADLQHDVSDQISVNASYTYLREGSGLLGAQGSGALGFDGGASTDAITVGAEARMPLGLALSSSATFANTRAASFDGGLLALPDNALSSAYQVSLRRSRVLSGKDAARFSLIQPLHIESGALEYTASYVSDLQTGELGVQTDIWELGGQRPLFAEFLYETPLWGERADLSLFTRTQISGESANQDITGIASGARFQIKF